jgi:chromosome segregation ATPase
MRNLTLLLVLVSGLLAGYLIGDYRGKNAREALNKAIETGKTLDAEREAILASLKAELDTINDRHHRELETMRSENASRMAAWRRSRNDLDSAINNSSAQLAESDSKLKALISQHEHASAPDKARLAAEIEQLRKEQEVLRREIDASACLQARVPHSVFEALNETVTMRKQR